MKRTHATPTDQRLMEFLEDIIRDRTPDLRAGLRARAGFSDAQAERFLPAAAARFVTAITSDRSSLDYSDLTSAANVEAISDAIDIDVLAGATGVSPYEGRRGLRALTRMLLSFIGAHENSHRFVRAMAGEVAIRLDFWAFHTEVHFPYRTRKLMSLIESHDISAK